MSKKYREATPIVPDFGITDEPEASQNSVLERGFWGFPKFPSSSALRDSTSHLTGGSPVTNEELEELMVLANTRAFLSVGLTLLKYGLFGYLIFCAVVWVPMMLK